MLEVRNISKNFGGVTAVDNVSVTVNPGEVVGLLGHNGSGKTTLLELIRGRIKPDKGTILLNGETLFNRNSTGKNGTATQIFRAYQIPRLFPFHTVGENLELGRWGVNGFKLDQGITMIEDGLPEYSQIAGTLSVGQRRRLILSWLYQRLDSVNFFLLDEPTAGGDSKYIEEMMGFIDIARKKGKGILIVEHNQQVLKKIADRTLFMNSGKLEEKQLNSNLPITNAVNITSVRMSEESLKAENLTIERGGATIIRNLSLMVNRGEILGITGANGCGKSTLLLALYGDPNCRVLEGNITDKLDNLTKGNIIARISKSIHLLPQEGGTFKSMTVAESLRASIDSCIKAQVSQQQIKETAFQVPYLEKIWNRQCGALSGGERRLVGLARILILQPRYALLDEPSAGLDETTQKKAARLIMSLAGKGTGFFIVEQNRMFLGSLCHRFTELKPSQ